MVSFKIFVLKKDEGPLLSNQSMAIKTRKAAQI